MSGNCKTCKNPGCVMRGSDWTPNPAIHCYGYEAMTNADRIRAMTDEELAKQLTWEQYAGIRAFLLGFDKELLEDFDSVTKKAWADSVQEKLGWLRREAKDEAT